ncbi:ABC transporter related protein [Magnetococcus marinus MC-1]|uniref:ABC transporter related protein n=1 Tax=Magnetococcus marinus (strain ATCC BAA-1437 / JCM 17883 / MC-1) TaxID=156889 RepID=A0LD53_MAGMM|nr:ABC transporter ATP-binding protein [Magnetococcus marinus]ABK45896.1 ABC transporter related protein [Magnetococcus marinus MC-1]
MEKYAPPIDRTGNQAGGRPPLHQLFDDAPPPDRHAPSLDPVYGEDLAPEDFPQETVPRAPVAFLWMLVRRHFAGRALAMMGVAALSIGVMGCEPPVLRRLVETLGQGGHSVDAQQAWFWFAMVAGIWLLSSLCNRAFQILDLYTAPRLRFAVQSYLYAYLQGHSPRYFQENFAGKLGQKIKQAGQSALPLLNILLHDGVRIITILAMGTVMLWEMWPAMSLTLLGWSVGFLGVALFYARRCQALSYAFSDEVSTSAGRLIDTITNIELVRAFSRQLFERRQLAGFLAREQQASERVRWFLIIMNSVLYTITLFFQVLLLAMVVHRVVKGELGVGDFVLVFSLITIVVNNVWNLSQRMLEFYEQLGILAEALAMVGQPHEIQDAPQAQPLQVTQGEVVFERLHFNHGDGHGVFHGLDLTIKAGEKVGLVGPSGAGKSTLVKLLRRQYDPQQGRICIDGQDIAQVTLCSLNDAIAEVPQLPGMLHRSIGDNLLYARLDAQPQELVDAAAQAHCMAFIGRRAGGMATLVGELGVQLSGGEKQRIAIARAFLKNAPILILDEATSSLDSQTEHLIQTSLWQLMEGRTVIAIAHRLSTLTALDRIIYLEQGEIVEMGTHRELLAKQGAYWRLWERQSGGFLPE